jgi:predicted XRE-type DNA-binding protein
MKGKQVMQRDIPVEKSSGNVYADLGYADSEDMLVKAQIVAKIAEIIEQRRLTQEQAAEILRLTQPKISRLLRGQFRGISERRLLRCLTRLGRDVQIVVKRTPRRRAQGRLTVRFA